MDATTGLAFDPRQLGALRTQVAKDDPEALRATAREFESLLVNQLMKSMRATRFDEDLMESDTTRTFTGMLDEQYARTLAQGKGLGLADMIVKQIEAAQAIKKTDGNAVNNRKESESWAATSSRSASAG